MKIRGRAKNQRSIRFKGVLTKMDKRLKQLQEEDIKNVEVITKKTIIDLTEHMNKKLGEENAT